MGILSANCGNPHISPSLAFAIGTALTLGPVASDPFRTYGDGGVRHQPDAPKANPVDLRLIRCDNTGQALRRDSLSRRYPAPERRALARKPNSKKKIRLMSLIKDGVSLLDAAEVFLLRLGGFLALMYELLRAFLHWK